VIVLVLGDPDRLKDSQERLIYLPQSNLQASKVQLGLMHLNRMKWLWAVQINEVEIVVEVLVHIAY